jgi:hypothetical protein
MSRHVRAYAHTRPPPFARMNARDARARRKKPRPSGTPRDLITMMTVEPDRTRSRQVIRL